MREKDDDLMDAMKALEGKTLSPQGSEHVSVSVKQELARAEEARASNGAALLALLVSWDINGAEGPRDEIQRAFGRAGFEGPPALDADQALARAVRESRWAKKSLDVRPVADASDTTYVVSRVTWRGSEPALDAGARIVAENGHIGRRSAPDGSELGECAALASEIVAKAQRLRDVAEGSDFSLALCAALDKLGAVSFRRRGGAYFVGAANADRWRSLMKEVERFGLSPCTLALHGAPENRAQVAEAARDALAADLAKLREQLATFDESTRDSTVERRVAAADELLAKAELFGAVLGGWTAELTKGVEAVKSACRAKLQGREHTFRERLAAIPEALGPLPPAPEPEPEPAPPPPPAAALPRLAPPPRPITPAWMPAFVESESGLPAFALDV